MATCPLLSYNKLPPPIVKNLISYFADLFDVDNYKTVMSKVSFCEGGGS